MSRSVRFLKNIEGGGNNKNKGWKEIKNNILLWFCRGIALIKSLGTNNSTFISKNEYIISSDIRMHPEVKVLT